MCLAPLPAERQAAAPVLHHDRRRVEKDGVALGHREVVHEAGGAHVDDAALHDPSRPIDAVERQMGTHELVAEGEELARAGVDHAMRGEGRVDASKIDGADGLEVPVEFDRQGHLDERKDAPGVGEDVGIGRAAAADPGVPPGLDVPVAIPARLAGLEAYPVDHAVTGEKESRVRSWPGIGTVPQVDAGELRGQRAGDREIVRRDLVGDRHEIAIANERLGRG